MFLNCLHQFIALLESNHELSRILIETDSILEIAAITDRVCKSPSGGKALLFEHPRGARFPVGTNLFGSLRRVCLALGVDHPDALTDKMSGLLNRIPNPDMACLDRQIAALPDFSRFAPRATDSNIPNLKAMVTSDLTVFPFLQGWPEDGSASGHSRYISLPLVFTDAPGGGSPNCGMYRAQVFGPTELAIRWKEGSGAARHLDAFRRRGERMPVAIALGGPPAMIFSAMFPLPGELDEMAFAGFLRGQPLDLAPCRSVPLSFPASSEIVIEGYVDPAETVMEGPFGNHTGFYSPAGPTALMRITSVSHRDETVIPATVVGPPPMEDCWMAKAWERILLAFLRRLAPAVAELHFPLEWIFHQSAIISLDKPTAGMVRETAEFLWSTTWFGTARMLVFIDAEADGADLSGVAWRAINLSEFSHDILFDTSGKRMALDATGCRFTRHSVCGDAAVAEQVAQRWREYGLD